MAFNTFADKSPPWSLTALDQNFSMLTGSTGSTLLGFIQSGTGAVAEPVQTSLRRIVALSQFDTSGHYDAAAAALVDDEVTYAVKGTAANEQVIGSRIYLNLNVKGLKRSFGAVGDGVADDTTPVTRAFASGKTIEIEEGTFLYSSGGVMTTRGNQVRGYGNVSLLKYTGAGVALQAVGSNDSWGNALKDFKLTTTTGTHGIRLKDLNIFTLDNVEVRGFSATGCHLTGTAVTGMCIYIEILKSRFMANTGDGLLADAVNTINQISMVGSMFNGNTGRGIAFAAGGRAVCIDGCDVEGNAGTCELLLDGGTGDGIDISGGYFESSTSHPAIIAGNSGEQRGLSIKGCIFQADLATTNAINLGVAAFVRGVNVSGNSFLGSYTNAINAAAVTGAVLGPNHCQGAIVHVVQPANSNTGVRIFNVASRVVVTYSASMTFSASLADMFDITATNNTAFAINAPTNVSDGMIVEVTIRNTSGGALGAVTWDAVFKMSTWTQPANGQSRSITFRYNGTNWVQIAQTGVDVPN